jgi:type VI secretion system FHA domain protein
VLLTLKITAGMKPGEVGRQVFTEDGGTIGRAATNAWVLTANKVSARHAEISFRNGVFYIADMSRNGVSVNSPDNRLVRERPYALKNGDSLFIEPYEIDVSIESESRQERSPESRRERSAFEPLDDLFRRDDPFGQARGPQPEQFGPVPPPAAGDEVDPLKFFEGPPAAAPSRQPDPVVTPADDWYGQHYVPPPAIPDPLMPPTPPPSAPARADVGIPADYNPLNDSGIGPVAPELLPPPPAIEPVRRPKPPSRVTSTPPAPAISPARLEPEAPPAAPRVAPPHVAPPPVVPAPPVQTPAESPIGTQPPGAPAGPAAASPDVAARDLGEVLAGAGLHGAPVTPELAQHLGQILRVVVSGLIDVLHSRQRIKEEFRMRQTIFRPVDNNPLKFSANVDDALHNLLVKRNAAYLGPVDAFSDAFDDLRDHQLAMLAGMRVAFEAMLADFDPERLQAEFDRQIGKVSLPLMPAKLRYWDLYREKREAIKKDPEAAFTRLFGEEFARAYEEQFRELRAQRRARAAEPPKDPRPPQT